MSITEQDNACAGAMAQAFDRAMPFIELVRFKSRAGVTADEVVSAAGEVNAFLKNQPGFLSRHLGRAEDGTWIDVLHWKSREHVMAAMAKVETSPHCSAFFGLIDPNHDDMTLFSSLLGLER